MPTTTLAGHQIRVDDEGFLAEPGEWTEELAPVLAEQIGITLTDAHWEAIRFLRNDATLRRIATVGGIPVKTLFQLFPQKPAKKLAYIAGLPKPYGCV
jgi:tRNA 2-thiouridine synthesizing protein E